MACDCYKLVLHAIELLETMRADIDEMKRAKEPVHRARSARKEKRYRLLSELCTSLGMGISWGTAIEISLILTGNRPCPPGMEKTVRALLHDDECAKSPGGIWNAIRLSDSNEGA